MGLEQRQGPSRSPQTASSVFEATRVRVMCDDCGLVRVQLPNLKLRKCVDTGRWTCCFRCPSCGLATAQATNEHSAIDLLTAIGVRVEWWRLPRELFEAKVLSPALTLDDLLDFHLLLDRHDWFAWMADTSTTLGSG